MRRCILRMLILLLLNSGFASARDSSSNAAIDVDRQALEYAQVGEFLYEALPFIENKSYTVSLRPPPPTQAHRDLLGQRLPVLR